MARPAAKIRLYVNDALAAGASVALSRDQSRYLISVMRLATGDEVLVFNGRDGEWLARTTAMGKRDCTLGPVEQTRAQSSPPDLWLMFAPIKKTRTDFIVEKATEMGVRRIAPVFTRHTNSERVNSNRLAAHCAEAAEQCGLLSVPEVACLGTVSSRGRRLLLTVFQLSLPRRSVLEYTKYTITEGPHHSGAETSQAPKTLPSPQWSRNISGPQNFALTTVEPKHLSPPKL